MAVNKNFVVKNGLEVSTDLILADATTNRVGIGSTIPDYTLQVIGGIGGTSLHVSGFTTSLTGLRVGGSGTVFTALGVGGSVGVGTALPAFLLDVVSPVSTGQTALYVKGDARITGDLHVDDFTVDDITIDQLNVTGISTFAGNIFVGTGATVGFGSTVFFRDNAKIELGDGDDLKIYHDGSNSYIDDTGTGGLYIRGGGQIGFRDSENSFANFANFNSAGSVDLWYNGSKKFETTASGVIVTGMTTVTGISSFQGNVHIAGSLEVAQDLTFDTNVNIIGIATLGTLDTTNFGTIGAGLTVVGNGVTSTTLNVTGVSTFAGVLDANDTTQSSSSTTGAAQFAGGVGVAKNLYVGGGQVTAGILTVTDLRVGTQLAGQTLVGITTILDEDNMASNSAAALVTQQSIKAYVDAQVTASDLDFQGDSGGAQSVDLDSQTFTIAGTANEIETSGSGQILTVGLPNFVNISNGLNVAGNGSTTTTLNVTGVSTFTSNILIGTGATVGFGSTAFFKDNAKAIFGFGEDLQIYHDGSNSYISDTGTGNLNITASRVNINNAANTETIARFIDGAEVQLYHDNSVRVATTTDGVDISGTGSIKVPVGTTAQRNASPVVGDFRYNSTLTQFEGYTGSWGEIGGGGSGGITTSYQTLTSTSPTGVGSFSASDFRSAHIIVGVSQSTGNNTHSYQTGRYLIIHDNTTATVLEESAVSTGSSMIATFDAVVATVGGGSTVTFRANMTTVGLATVSLKIDTINSDDATA